MGRVSRLLGETVIVDGSPVENVLVEPGEPRDATDVTAPVGAVIAYTLRFPLDSGTLKRGQRVTVRGHECSVVGFSDHWRPADVFGNWSVVWDMTAKVELVEGEMTASITVTRVTTSIDDLGDPVPVTTTVYEGSAQARLYQGATAGGTANETDEASTWYFVFPWVDGVDDDVKALTIEWDGAVYDPASVERDDGMASIKAVRHG